MSNGITNIPQISIFILIKAKSPFKKDAKKILRLRLLYRNKNNIKLLYLNNYNKKDILTINAEHLNYSIFDKSNKYKLDNKLIPINYHPEFHPDNTSNYNIRL